MGDGDGADAGACVGVGERGLILTAALHVTTDLDGVRAPDLRQVVAEVDGGVTDSEWVARVLGRPVIKAFNNIVAHSLAIRIRRATRCGATGLARAVACDAGKRTIPHSCTDYVDPDLAAIIDASWP